MSNQIANVPTALTANAFTRTGYSFVDWTTIAGGTGTHYSNSEVYPFNADITLFAKWTPNTYTVTYDANGSTGGTKPADQTKTHDVTLVLATNSGNLVKTGYTFSGWNTLANGTGIDYSVGANYTANAGVTLFAKWTPNTYTVTYDANGSTGGTKPADQTKTHDVTLVLATNSGNLVKTGYTFSGWNTLANGTGIDYSVGANYTANAGVTLFAKWTPNTYTVTYDANGSTGGTKPANQTKTHDVTLVLATNSGNLVKTGYTFSGWNTLANGTGIDYSVGANYTANAGVTLFAKWTTADLHRDL